MRAVGMDERQVMKMIAAESATYATLGALRTASLVCS